MLQFRNIAYECSYLVPFNSGELFLHEPHIGFDLLEDVLRFTVLRLGLLRSETGLKRCQIDSIINYDAAFLTIDALVLALMSIESQINSGQLN